VILAVKVVPCTGQSVDEPPWTCKVTAEEIRKFADEPMQGPQWPCHAQSIEGCVKQVTEAASRAMKTRKKCEITRNMDL
ncbi:hypothetical protein E2320_012840, partial [Naja naja]